MTDDALIGAQLAGLFRALSHPDRIRIVTALRDGERDVLTLQNLLSLPQSRVSRQLGLLRAQHIVLERRGGRHVYYRLSDVRIAGWLLDGLDLVRVNAEQQIQLRNEAEKWRAAAVARASVTNG